MYERRMDDSCLVSRDHPRHNNKYYPNPKNPDTPPLLFSPCLPLVEARGDETRPE